MTLKSLLKGANLPKVGTHEVLTHSQMSSRKNAGNPTMIRGSLLSPRCNVVHFLVDLREVFFYSSSWTGIIF